MKDMEGISECVSKQFLTVLLLVRETISSQLFIIGNIRNCTGCVSSC
jgi:hypothetical protein